MPQQPSLGLVVDHNVWISYLLTRSFPALADSIDRAEVRLLYWIALLEDLLEVLDRPKLAMHIDALDTELLIHRIRQHGEAILVRSVLTICRDPDDDHLLSLCKDGRADVLITGDEDLLVLKKFGTTVIQSPVAFLRTQR